MTPTGHSRVSASVPASIWDFPEHGSRGPRARHDRAAIAALAVRIADAEGLDAVTMRRLAGELGIAVMSLYNYVPAKEHLAQLMTDQLAGEYAYPVRPPSDPRAAIADLARQTRDIARRHAWLAGLLHPPMPPGPNGLRYLDYFLGLLADSRLGTGARLEIITMIRGFATMYGALQAAPASPSEQTTAQVQALTRAAAQGRYPNLAAALADAGPPRRHDDIFRSGIERLIETARLRLRRPDFQVAARQPWRGRDGRSRIRIACQCCAWYPGAVTAELEAAEPVRPLAVEDAVDADLVAGGPLRAVEAAGTMVPPRDRRDRAATSGISRGAALRPGIQWSRPGGDAGIR